MHLQRRHSLPCDRPSGPRWPAPHPLCQLCRAALFSGGRAWEPTWRWPQAAAAGPRHTHPRRGRGGWVPTVAEAVRAAAVAEAGWPPLWDHALGAECLSGPPCPEPGPGLHAGLRWVSVGGWAGTRTRGKLTRQAEPHRRACPLPETRRLSRLHLPVAPVCQAVGQALMGGRKLTGPREGWV